MICMGPKSKYALKIMKTKTTIQTRRVMRAVVVLCNMAGIQLYTKFRQGTTP